MLLTLPAVSMLKSKKPEITASKKGKKELKVGHCHCEKSENSDLAGQHQGDTTSSESDGKGSSKNAAVVRVTGAWSQMLVGHKGGPRSSGLSLLPSFCLPASFTYRNQPKAGNAEAETVPYPCHFL